MDPALWAAKTGLDAQQTRMTVTANNLANVNTSGFKKDRAVFEDLLYQNIHQPGANTSQTTQSPSGLELGTGVRVVTTTKSYSQGSPTQTGNSLDLAIQGRGFFQIQMPDGSLAYTRDGSFQPNAQGQLVTSSGAATTTTPGLNGTGTLQQGALEGSNVNVVEELVNMIETQRSYEMNSKAISTTDQMLQYVTQNL